MSSTIYSKPHYLCIIKSRKNPSKELTLILNSGYLFTEGGVKEYFRKEEIEEIAKYLNLEIVFE